uniref:ATP-dependent DNA helicase n=1 Tax=Brassica oleracea var. oleracea TaxID=109376 RepID=A0A0D2ZST1_BRAOL
MRVNQDEKEFSEWLLKVGEEGRPESGQEDEDDAYHDQMVIVDNSLVQETKDESLKQLVDASYGDVNKIKASQISYTDKAILTPRNDTVDEINAYTISKPTGSQETTTVTIALRFRKLNIISIPWSFQDCHLINSLSKLGPRLCFCET